ncbi:hypothetical protein P692DRAFT_20877848 [Suillus brevipes Sb2]|nr:hypothetical protein P692DRAFT_20877848 [Suillus brevipes Sb2]
MKNTVSLGHIANRLSGSNWTGNITAFNPLADISTGSLYGPLPASWLPRVTNASHVGESSISSMGRALTTAWDESQAPVQTAPGTSSISAIPVADEASSEEPSVITPSESSCKPLVTLSNVFAPGSILILIAPTILTTAIATAFVTPITPLRTHIAIDDSEQWKSNYDRAAEVWNDFMQWVEQNNPSNH